MTALIRLVVDDSDFFEIHADWAKNLVVGFARLGGKPVGVVANQPDHLAGVLDIDASVKGARSVRFCDAFNVPLVVFEDVPRFLPGTKQEFGGIIRHGAKLLFAFAEATVPKLTVITRKAYGGAYLRHGVEAHSDRLQRRLPDGRDRRHGAGGGREHPLRQGAGIRGRPGGRPEGAGRGIRGWFREPVAAARKGYIDEALSPGQSRRLIRALDMLGNKREATPPKKHGNIPL